MTEHICRPPVMAAVTAPQQPDWTCAVCERIWRDCRVGSLQWWAEVRGPAKEVQDFQTVTRNQAELK